MKFLTPFLSLLVLTTSHPTKPLRTHTISSVPPDLYASNEPFFAGSPIALTNSPSDPLAPGPGRYGMTYTPYTSDGKCKTYPSIYADMTRIARAGFSAVRLYATDCDSVRSAGLAALQLDLRLILGVHVGEHGIVGSAIDAQVASITTFLASDSSADGSSSAARKAHAHAVDAVVVGNEAVFNGFASAREMHDLARAVRASLAKAGYTGPVTIAEPYGIWLDPESSRWLCPAVDVVSANLLPFFVGDVRARVAGNFVEAQMHALSELCPVDEVKSDSKDSVLHGDRNATAPSAHDADVSGAEGRHQSPLLKSPANTQRSGHASSRDTHDRGASTSSLDELEDIDDDDDDDDPFSSSQAYSATPTSPSTPSHKPVLAMELGWPSAGKHNRDAMPGHAEQRLAIRLMSEAVGSRAVFASFEDDAWRDGGDFGVETHWGCVGVFE